MCSKFQNFLETFIILYLRNQFVLERKHFVTIVKADWLMLFKKIINVYFENYTELINTLSEKSAKSHSVTTEL
jgi:hypothetical protein